MTVFAYMIGVVLSVVAMVGCVDGCHTELQRRGRWAFWSFITAGGAVYFGVLAVLVFAVGAPTVVYAIGDTFNGIAAHAAGGDPNGTAPGSRQVGDVEVLVGLLVGVVTVGWLTLRVWRHGWRAAIFTNADHGF